ncbi:hypothetical protein DE146DRAFT_374145 [Phaeosphaeria sp. MPI-PUGE-AT-0046c]|nr:hypothetical protein DE146DRAFT_374145 [Phaeosphaeria sp. MPI-PUGE-AT-0046c]
MAKKKNKKSNQKQVEAALPPETISAPTTATTAIATGAPPENLSASLAPPLETANEESLLGVAVAASDEPLEGTSERPSNDTAMGAGQTTNNVVTQSLENEDMGVRTTDSMKEANGSTVNDQSHVAVAETHSQLNTPDVVDSQTEPSDVLCTLPKPVIAADVTAMPPSIGQLDPSPETTNGEAQADEIPATTNTEGTAMISQALESNHATNGEPLNDDAQGKSSIVPTVTSAKPAVAEPQIPPPIESSREIMPEPETISRSAVEAIPPPSVALTTPLEMKSPILSQQNSVTDSSLLAEANAPQASIDDHLDKSEVSPLPEMPAREQLSSTTPAEPRSEKSAGTEEYAHSATLSSAPHAVSSDDLPAPSLPQPSKAQRKELTTEESVPSFDPPVTKSETPKQRRRREAEEAEEREEQERLEQASFEQYRIDQERLEMARLEQKRLERAKNRQERLEKERIEQQRVERVRLEKERLEHERVKEERRERERLEQDRLEKERLEQERLEHKRAEEERLEKERLERERLEHERLEMERLRNEQLEKERDEKRMVEIERLERDRLEQERLSNEIVSRERLELERLEKERLEKDRALQEQAERENIKNERAVLERSESEIETLNYDLPGGKLPDAKTFDQKKYDEEGLENNETKLESERLKPQHQEVDARPDTTQAEPVHIPPAEQRYARMPASHPEPTEERVLGPRAPDPSSPTERQPMMYKEVPDVPAQLPTPQSEASSKRLVMSDDLRTSKPTSRLPTPTASVGRGSSPRSATVEDSQARSSHSPPGAMHAHRSQDVEPVTDSRHVSGSPALPAPRPQAVSQIIADSRPPAPSPPVGRARPRHIPAFDTDDDSDSSAMVRPRRQYRGGEEFPRDGSSGSAQGYPPQPTHHRSVFASRVPAEPAYSNPPPPQPPGYHPGVSGYYPSTAPPHYQNHNYRVSQQGYPPTNAYGPSTHPSSSPYTEPWNYPPGYRHDSPPHHRHDTLVSRDYPLGLAPLDTRPALGDDPGDVFSRIAQAIPDLHVLLARYKETHGQLSVREELLRRSSIEQEQRLRLKDDEIAELMERTRTLEQKYSTEAGRLRFQIGNLEEQAKELQEQRAETDKFKNEASESKIALEVAMRSWDTKYKELEEAHAILARTSAEERASFEEWKSTYTTRNDAEKIALAIQFDVRLKEADVLAESQRQEAIASYLREKDELRSDYDRQQLELQASFEQERMQLETKLEAAQRDRDEAIQHERESREIWHTEREALLRSHEEDREGSRKSLDEQRDLLEAQYRKSRDESDKAWIELHADAAQKVNEEKARVDDLVKEKEELQRRYNALKAESEQEKAIIKSVASNLESEKSRLEKLMECYGDIAEIKSKGDTY